MDDGYLEGYEDGVGFADDAYDGGTLLDGFLGIFDLEHAALRRAGGGISEMLWYGDGWLAYYIMTSLS